MADAALCRDRYGLFPPDMFKLITCSMCYSYLFRLKGHLTTNLTSPTELVPKTPQGPYPQGTCIKADVDNNDAVNSVCSTLSSEDCTRWTRCCEAAVRCCDRQLNEPPRNTTELFCPRTWDGFGCFGDTDASQKVYIHCPLYVEYASPWGNVSVYSIAVRRVQGNKFSVLKFKIGIIKQEFLNTEYDEAVHKVRIFE
ncbi:hypothetical protein ACJMK2_023528 [Sinanodonta woodiana]|uniref:G-protein coupled receptors family 2 profile 1 domain-containing protein n=1 Tax=Sinanodonta woodiana TaxID=1069815 RepID=A0ABD3T5C6_SINWO